MRNQSVKEVSVRLQQVKVTNFSPTDNRLTLSISFEDGKNKEITKTTRLKEPSLLSLQLMEELIIMEKNVNMDFDGEVLTGDANVTIENRHTTEAMLVDFFQTLYSKAQKIKNARSSEGYMDMLRDFQRTVLKL